MHTIATKGLELKIKLLYLFTILAISLNASTIKTNYILNTSGLIDERVYIKINEIGEECALIANTEGSTAHEQSVRVRMK